MMVFMRTHMKTFMWIIICLVIILLLIRFDYSFKVLDYRRLGKEYLQYTRRFLFLGTIIIENILGIGGQLPKNDT